MSCIFLALTHRYDPISNNKEPHFFYQNYGPPELHLQYHFSAILERTEI